MKTNELKKWLTQNNYEFQDYGNVLAIYVQQSSMGPEVYVAIVSEERYGIINTQYSGILDLGEGKVKDLLFRLTDYALTPVEKRKDEVRFRVLLRPAYYKDLKYFKLALREKGYANETGEELEPVASEFGEIFTPTTYSQFLNDYPEWQMFLPNAFDPENPMFEVVEDEN